MRRRKQTSVTILVAALVAGIGLLGSAVDGMADLDGRLRVAAEHQRLLVEQDEGRICPDSAHGPEI